MTAPAPGWYPDPNSTRGMLRYWDGTQWTQHTTPIPTEPSPTEAAPTRWPTQQTDQSAQPAAGPTGPGPSGNGKKLALIIGAAVLALALIGTGGFFGLRALIGHDHSSSASSSDSTNESSPETSDAPTPSDEPSATAQPTPAGTPLRPKSSQSCYGGMPMRNALPLQKPKLRTPGLSAPMPRGWAPKRSLNGLYHYLDAVAMTLQFQEKNWVSTMAVARVPDAITTQFQDPQLIAEEILACSVTSPKWYRKASAISTPTNAKLPPDLTGAVVSGVVTDISLGRPRRDLVTVAVVEIEPQKYATFIAATPPGDSNVTTLVYKTVRSLTSP